MAFTVTCSGTGAQRVLVVGGDLDIASSSELRDAGEAAFAAEDCSTVRLDVKEVTFMDSTGLGVLVGLRNTAEKVGKDLVIANPSFTVARLLELSGLLGVFQVDPVIA